MLAVWKHTLAGDEDNGRLEDDGIDCHQCVNSNAEVPLRQRLVLMQIQGDENGDQGDRELGMR